MKRFFLKLLVTLIVFYGLGAVAYGLLRYPDGERPEWQTVLADYTNDLGAVFRRKEPAAVAPGKTPVAPAEPRSAPEKAREPSSLDDLKGDAFLTMPLAHVIVPGSLDRLPVKSAEMWGTLKPIHETVLPEAASDLTRLRALKSTDKPAFEKEREATRARLAQARKDLQPYVEQQPPFPAAVTMLEVLEDIDKRLAGL